MTEVIKDRRWTLKITTFRGTAFNAEHYYGTMSRDVFLPDGDSAWMSTEEVRLEYQLTMAEARRMREKDDYHWKAGEWYSGFWNKDDIIAAARLAMEEFADEGDFLVKEDMTADEGEEEVLVGSSEGYVRPRDAGGWSGTTMGFGNPLERVTIDMGFEIEKKGWG